MPEFGCGAVGPATVESGVFDLDMEGASNDLDTGSDGAVDLTLEDGRERVPPVASDRVGVNVGVGSLPLHMEAERRHAEGESYRSPPTRSRPLTLSAGRPNPGPGSAW